MPENHLNIKGLSTDQVIQAREKFGLNKLDYKKGNTFLNTLKRIAQDPMIILLLVASSIYFMSGKNRRRNFSCGGYSISNLHLIISIFQK